MKRGRKPAPSVTFYMRSREYGDIKILFSYGGCRYAGGTTYISLGTEEFELLRSDGSPREEFDERNPKIANGIPVSRILGYLRGYIVGEAERHIACGGCIDEVYVKALCSKATRAMYERLRKWSSDLDWNMGVNRAIAQGGDALDEIIGVMFKSLEV